MRLATSTTETLTDLTTDLVMANNYNNNMWITIKGIDGKAKREAENEAITFNGMSFSSFKHLATKFNTSKLGRHTS